ncbi:MAG TPA: prepilin-type N-terminal cleavage/methylation domain-containing protein [Candidatus Saccharimonadales bacterium]|nr:prepilin-type N-terminal cleavage/methylation domain-containing protein [Candidatus Saccharimonadales bacterium]
MSGNIDIRRNQSGFTIVELTITITLMAILSVGFIAAFTNFLVSSQRTNTRIEMTNDSQNLLRVLVEELRYGAGVRQTNSITDPNAPAGGWNTDNTNFVIITAVPALDSSNEYIIDPDTGEPYMNEYVYYKTGTTLYKRTLANPGATGNRSVTSCPASLASASCPADRELVENVGSMTFTLYDQDNATTTTALNARSVQIDLTLSKDTFGQPITYDNSIRITLRNNFS